MSRLQASSISKVEIMESGFIKLSVYALLNSILLVHTFGSSLQPTFKVKLNLQKIAIRVL
jgi:hypothetical protein